MPELPSHGSHRVLVRLLGPIELVVDGRALVLQGHRERAIVGALALRAGEVVSTSRLADVVWGPSPPRTAAVQIQSCVSALRRRSKALGVADPRDVLATRSPGYVLPTATVDTDIATFRRLVHDASVAARRGDHAHAHAVYRDALDLWRGDAFADVTAPEFDAAGERLTDEWLTAVEARADADLALGAGSELVTELTDLLTRHPLREGLRARLMHALCRADRQSDALDVYQEGRRLLADELGLDPGDALTQLHERVLRGDPSLLHEPDDAKARFQATLPTPRQLPPDIATFVGRDAELDQLTATLVPDAHSTVPAVVGLHGGGGAGKTTFAVRLAHQVRESFPDGQLYAHLGGTAGPAVAPSAVLAGFLRAFDIAGENLPDGLDERVALYRSCLADRKVLVVLDDAADAAQVRPLLPATPGGAAVVTSRPPLTELDAAEHVAVETLDHVDAVHLLRVHVGDAHVDADPAAADRIAELCGHLPLALRIAAARLTRASGAPALTRFARRLTDERRRLDLLTASDLAVRTTLQLSWASLGDDQRTLLGRLTLLPATEFPEWVAAMLLDTDEDAGHDLLGDLAMAHLVDVTGSDAVGHTTYRLHDLVRLVAAENLAATEDERAGQHALARVRAAWLGLAEIADAHTLVSRSFVYGLELAGTAPKGTPPAVEEHPIDWFESWYPVIARTVEHAVDDAPDTAALLAIRLYAFLSARRYTHVTLRMLDLAAGATSVRVDLRTRLLLQLTNAHGLADAAPVETTPIAERALESAKATGDPYLEAKARDTVVLCLCDAAEYDAALDETDQLLPVAQAVDVNLHAHVHFARGIALRGKGLPEASIEQFDRSLDLVDDGSRSTVVNLLHRSRALLDLDRAVEAETTLGRGIDISLAMGDERFAGFQQLDLAEALARQDRWADADEVCAQALATLYAPPGPTVHQDVMIDYYRGKLDSLRGRHPRAVDQLGKALSEAERLRTPWLADLVRRALADAYQRAGDQARASAYRRQLPYDTSARRANDSGAR